MKDVLNKLFPNHSTGTAAFMVAQLVAALLVVGFSAYDVATQDVGTGEILANAVMLLVFVGGAVVTFAFGGKDK